MYYDLIRKLMFTLPAETSHDLTIDWLGAAERLKLLQLFAPKVPDCPVEVMGIKFPNPVGLAAGLDKNADALNAFGALGFGFVEVGTVTPRPQPGNPKPRLFRLPEHQAIINRMGFNNKGVDHLLERVKAKTYAGPVGINIGKNFDTAVEDANEDYLIGLRKAYPLADYVSVNVSSPNTPGLRSLQFGDALKDLLEVLKNEQKKLELEYSKYVPIAVKVAPDMDEDEIKFVASTLKEFEFDGVITTNTTLDRKLVENDPTSKEAGGLSGAPLFERSTDVVRQFYAELGDSVPIIGVGGISEGENALEKIKAGAKLVQIYSGFIYKGPGLIRESVESIRFGC